MMAGKFMMVYTRDKENHRAFTLIELIGALVVIAILAATLAPVLIRHMDRIASEQESASLKSIGDALQQSIMRHRYIPSDDWATNIALELGVNVSNVKVNSRKQPRYFLIDHDMQIGSSSAGQVYSQTASGAPTRPQNARLLIV